MHLESTIYLDEALARIFRNLTDYQNFIWRRDVQEVKAIDNTHFIEYNLKHYPTFVTVIKNTKNKKYELEMINNDIEGTICYQFKKQENFTEIQVVLDIQFVNSKWELFSKRKVKKYWSHLIEDLNRVGK